MFLRDLGQDRARFGLRLLIGEPGSQPRRRHHPATAARLETAATGDIGLVDGWFAVDGPQYAQLRSEADSILPGGVYDFALAEGVVVVPGLVRGTVTITGGNGATQTYLWDFELIHQDNRWRVWTVRTTPEEPET